MATPDASQVDLSFAIGLPPEEAIAYFESKGYAIGFKWQDVWAEAHAKAFTVAGVTKLDVLTDIRGALDSALKTGETLSDFQQRLQPLLEAKGWWGKGRIVDESTGEIHGKRLNLRARFRCLGGIDVDPAAIRDFDRLVGVPGMVMDLFDRSQYIDFHGHEPPADWCEATPADIRRAMGNERPHIWFLSAPCKGFSGLLNESRSKTAKYQALIPATKVGRGWVFLESDLVNFLRAKQNEQRQKAQVGEVKGEVCRSIKEERLGGAISQRQAENELDSLLARVTGRKPRNSTTN